jgi:hypothetical protein
MESRSLEKLRLIIALEGCLILLYCAHQCFPATELERGEKESSRNREGAFGDADL